MHTEGLEPVRPWSLVAFDPPDEEQARELARFMRAQHAGTYPRAYVLAVWA
jgi:hypothetical protein